MNQISTCAGAGVKRNLSGTGIGTHLIVFSLFVLESQLTSPLFSITSTATEHGQWPKLKLKPKFLSHNFDFFALILT